MITKSSVALSVALTLALACGAPNEEGQSSDELSAPRVHDFDWFAEQSKRVVAAANNQVLGNARDTMGTASWLATREDFAGRPLYSFPLATHQRFIQNEILNTPELSLGYVAKVTLTEFVEGAPDLSWRAGWPSGPIEMSTDVYLDGAGYDRGQHFQGGTVHVSIRGTSLEHLEVSYKGPLMERAAVLSTDAGGHHFESFFSFRLIENQKIEVINYRSVTQPGTLEGQSFKFGGVDFPLKGQFRPAVGTFQ